MIERLYGVEWVSEDGAVCCRQLLTLGHAEALFAEVKGPPNTLARIFHVWVELDCLRRALKSP